MIRIEFYNGHVSSKKKYEKFGRHVLTNHNPCLWANFGIEEKPWREVYPKALEFIEMWKNKIINDTELLHSLRYVAYGYNANGEDKKDYDNEEVIWPGNLTIDHKPKLVVKNGEEEYTLYFSYVIENEKNDIEYLPTDNNWKIVTEEGVNFYWQI